jgi:hypothetical protein
MQRRILIRSSSHIRIGTSLEQECDDGFLAFRNSTEKCCLSFFVKSFEVLPAFRKEGFDFGFLAAGDGLVEERLGCCGRGPLLQDVGGGAAGCGCGRERGG